MVAMTGGDSAIKNLIAGAFGALLATVGQDLTTGVERYTFGIHSFSDGIEFIPVLIGLFALAELLEQAAQLGERTVGAKLGAVRLPSWQDIKDCSKAIGLSSVLGTFIGILPALGATTAAMIAYVETKRWSKNKAEFGHGAIEGVAAPEGANNAETGGALVPLLTLGIPGSGTTAVLLAALILWGFKPGPLFIQESPTLFWGLVASMYIGNVMLLVLNLPLVAVFAQLLKMPAFAMYPMILGVFAGRRLQRFLQYFRTRLLAIFGLLGYGMRKLDYPNAPLVLGLVLGRMVEETLKQSLLISTSAGAASSGGQSP